MTDDDQHELFEEEFSPIEQPSFINDAPSGAPLADRMRPRALDEYLGQVDIVGDGAPLRRLIERDQLRSMIFWGPPGTGKTTLATIIARQTKSEFVSLSAVTSGIKDARTVMERARQNLRRFKRRTILFIDEIHRFNKAQQDAFLPFVEDGSVILIGATTENPSFSVVAALMSRCRVFVLKSLTDADVVTLLRRAMNDTDRGLGSLNLSCDESVLGKVASLVDGDARRALNLLELAGQLAEPAEDGTRALSEQQLASVMQRQHLLYDKTGEEHYNVISALHKSMRSSDTQGAVYWCARMLQSGDDPLYVSRRMIRFASEDIGNADPQALIFALAARQTYEILGTPEGELALLQCASYLATAPKSNAIYVAQHKVNDEIAASGSLPVPMHIRNAPTKLMKDIGYGKGYQYDHDTENAFSGQECLPDNIGTRVFYEPNDIGFEREIKKRMDWWAQMKAKKTQKK